MSGKRALLLVIALLAVEVSSALALTFTVNSTGDEVDPELGDNVCGIVPPSSKGDPSSGPCTLRAAIQTANANGTTDTIQFNLSANGPGCVDGVCTINLREVLPDLSTPISISGPGAAQLIVRHLPGAVAFRIFTVTTGGTVNLSALTISDGSTGDLASHGGNIHNVSTGIVNVDRCTVKDAFAFGSGGGIANTGGGRVNVTNSLIDSNVSVKGGGGIANFNLGILTVRNSTLSSNRTTALQGEAPAGGAIASFGGTSNITNCTITGNTANGPGGGIAGSDTVNITNCTISGNSATGSGVTGDNLGGGVYNSAGTITVKSSIIAGNTGNDGGPDVNGAFDSGGFNLIGKKDASTGFTAATDQGGSGKAPVNPQLDPAGLQDNGGPTETIALLAGSPAIDQGSSAAITGSLTTDQRGSGFPRVSDDPAIANAAGGDGADVGAFERQVAAPTPTPTATATPTATPAATPVTTLANISTRLRVETGDNVLIGGFIVTGTQPKKVIVRAIGTSLPLADKLADPTLELHGPNGLIEANDNWVDSPNKQAIIDSTIPPSSDFDSAIVHTLPAAAGYTAIVRGVNNSTGIGVVEAYDLDTTVDSRLANISTRGFVQTGDNVLIAGTIVVGQASQRVLIRAIGPSLPIAGVMANPTLELRDSSGTLLQANDNWVDSADKQAIIDTTIPPPNDLESAIVAILPANNASYTAIVRGVNDTTGIAVVEIYALP